MENILYLNQKQLFDEKGKPIVRWGRKAKGSQKGIAWLPNQSNTRPIPLIWGRHFYCGGCMREAESGFTLMELMVVVWILSVTIIGMVQLFIYTSVQAEMAGRKTLAISEAQSKLEEIRNHTYASITTDYISGGTPGNTFTPVFFTGRGAVYIDSAGSFITGTNAELLGVKVTVSWRDKYNRIVGEDTNLNGVLDGGEDRNGNGQLDSPVTLMGMITRR